MGGEKGCRGGRGKKKRIRGENKSRTVLGVPDATLGHGEREWSFAFAAFLMGEEIWVD